MRCWLLKEVKSGRWKDREERKEKKKRKKEGERRQGSREKKRVEGDRT